MVEFCIISILQFPFVWWCSSLSANPSRFIGLKVAAFLRWCYLTPILFGLTDGNAGALLIKKTGSALWSTQPVQTGGCGADTYLRELSGFFARWVCGHRQTRLDWDGCASGSQRVSQDYLCRWTGGHGDGRALSEKGTELSSRGETERGRRETLAWRQTHVFFACIQRRWDLRFTHI